MPSPEPQPRAADPRIAALLERVQAILAEHPMRNGALCWRGWPAPGEAPDWIDDPDLEAHLARARREDERDAAGDRDAALAQAEAPPVDVEFGVPPEHIVPATAARPPPANDVVHPQINDATSPTGGRP